MGPGFFSPAPMPIYNLGRRVLEFISALVEGIDRLTTPRTSVRLRVQYSSEIGRISRFDPKMISR
ncbi:hypothetical protein DXT87_13745 [Arthrobacter sp. AET 35A]|nr:hypothetical protein [Arthrobacter sp. AET 35A]